jgi:hypothetical protein
MVCGVVDHRDAAFYYPGIVWHDDGWIKSLALFFDQIALLVPDYMRDRPHRLDPAIAEGLEQAGLLRILSPEQLIDKDASETLASGIADVLAGGALDRLPDAGPFQELSWSRMGGLGDAGLAQMLFEELQHRGLARQSEDGFSVPLHPVVRSLFLVLLAQILRDAGPRVGLDLSPATDRPEIQAALVQLLALPAPAHGAAEVVSFDLDFVGPDLSSVSIEDIVDFRGAHGREFQAYARRLREIVRDLGALEGGERSRALDERREEIREAGDALRSGAVREFGTKASIGLGLVGGAVSAAHGSPFGDILSAASVGVGIAARPRTTITPYSYLFSARQHFA